MRARDERTSSGKVGGAQPDARRGTSRGDSAREAGPAVLTRARVFSICRRVMAGPRTPYSRGAAPWRGAVSLLGTLAATQACGGAAPLLHPARPLPIGTVSAGAGVSGQFASSDIDGAIGRGRSAATQSLSDREVARTYATGVLARALVGPGASPWVSARVGLPENLEAGLTYAGRSLRLDGRHVLPIGDAWGLSLGLGATALLSSPDSTTLGSPNPGEQPPGEAEFGLDGRGWGADVPVLFGYESFGGFFELWTGLRVGYETLSGELRTNVRDPLAPVMNASGDRIWASGLAGFSLGVPPVWFRFELSATAHRLSGELSSIGAGPEPEAATAELTGWSFAPSGSLVGKF
jgi:hypothetical protein